MHLKFLLDFGQNERVLGQKTRERENAKTGQRKELDIVLLPACGIPPRAGGTFDAMLYPPQEGGWGLDCFDSPFTGLGV